MQLTQFLSEAAIYREAIKTQIIASVWTSQGKKTLDSSAFSLDAAITDYL